MDQEPLLLNSHCLQEILTESFLVQSPDKKTPDRLHDGPLEHYPAKQRSNVLVEKDRELQVALKRTKDLESELACVREDKVTPSPEFMQDRLQALGICIALAYVSVSTCQR